MLLNQSLQNTIQGLNFSLLNNSANVFLEQLWMQNKDSNSGKYQQLIKLKNVNSYAVINTSNSFFNKHKGTDDEDF